jgi:hypothetical protein
MYEKEHSRYAKSICKAKSLISFDECAVLKFMKSVRLFALEEQIRNGSFLSYEKNSINII